MIYLYVGLGITLYCMVVGVVFVVAKRYLYHGPPDFRSSADADFLGGLIALFWPFMAPILLSGAVASMAVSKWTKW